MRDSIERLLPSVFQVTAVRGSALDALLLVMQDMMAPAAQTLDNLEVHFDPYRAPDRFVPMLAAWVDLDWVLPEAADEHGHVPYSPGYGRLRELIAGAARLARRRGTRNGLIDFLETATGVHGFRITENPDGRSFHLKVEAPDGAERFRSLVQRMIDMEKPGHVTFDLVFDADASQGQQHADVNEEPRDADR